MRRLALLIVLIGVVVPTSAFAGSWRLFRGGPLGLTVRYPASWHAAASYLPGNTQLALGYVGRTNFSLTIKVVPIKPAGTIRAMLKRFTSYEQRSHGSLAGHHQWQATRLGKYPSMATIVRPSTEGGVAMAEALYVTQSRHHLYAVTEVTFSHPSPNRLDQFPGIYRQIVQTLHFR